MATLPLVPTTELEAVNFLLISIGEQPVNDLDSIGISEVSIARSLIHQTSRQVQSAGWSFNSEENYPIPINIDNEIVISSNVLKIDASDNSKDVVRRGGRLYNRADHTYLFEETLEVDIVYFFPYEDLPQVFRDYIAVRAARLFQSKVLGSEALYAFSMQDEEQAYKGLVASEIDNQDLNILQNPSIMTNLRRV